MSRSKRKNPIKGVTGAPSEKKDKAASHRTIRRVTKIMISTTPETPFPPEKKLVNPWSMEKDGKYRFDRKADAKLIRK